MKKINPIENEIIDDTSCEFSLKDMKCTKEEFDRLLIENQNFPYSVVNKEFSKYPWDVKQDLYSAAVSGMVKAATKYDPARANECKFISYAVNWIRYYIVEEIRKIYPVKFNQNFMTKRKKVITCISDYKDANNGQEPSVDYIAKTVKMSKKVVSNILKVNKGENFQFISFNCPTENEKSGEKSESLNTDHLVKEYLDENTGDNILDKIDFDNLMIQLKKEVGENDFKIFYDYYINQENFTDLAKKYNLKFPSSAAYLIKKCEQKCKELLRESV